VSALDLALLAVGLLAGTWLLASVPTLRPAPTKPQATLVSVVIPARNEARNLPRLLDSLAALRPGPHEVIVVDDGSTDGTAAVAESHGATVVTAPPLPAGWVGKPWACHHGAAAATGTHLLFLDADTWLSPDGLTRLAGEYEAGLLSVGPYHETREPYEQLSAPFMLSAAMGTGVFTPLASRRTAAAAFGPCLLTHVAAYRTAGGHAAVSNHVIEDVALARRYRAAGLPVRCLAGGDAVRFRMYPDGFRQLVEGWSKNIAAGVGEVGAGAPLATLGAVAWVTACVSVAASLVVGLAGWVGGGDAPVAAAVAYAVVGAQWWWMLRRLGSFQWWAMAGFVVPLTAFLVVFARSAALTFVRRRVSWRGRAIPARR
jgi:4,4'-diaponeurosporenoate glycosyltransferase